LIRIQNPSNDVTATSHENFNPFPHIHKR